MTKSSGQDAALRDHFAENVKSPLLRKEIKKFIIPHPEFSFPDTREEAIRCADEDEKSCGQRPRVASSHETSTSTKPSSLESAMNEMIKTLQGQQKAIEDLAANLKKLNTVSTNRGQNVQPQPQFQQRQPRPDVGGDGVISAEPQDTLPQIAQEEVDPHPSGTSPPGLHLTRQTSPPPPCS